MPPYSKLLLPAGRRRHHRLIRLFRAMYRDSSALLTEFRRPLIVFLLATLGGGWLYSELQAYAGYERLPYYDMPYFMVALMILEAPTDIPREPYLIIFWYLMPAIALYVVGRGVADFVRLFFNRNERRDAWEEAVASTYRNHIIVLGIGHVGLRVIRVLAQMGFEVVGIEKDLEVEIDAELSMLGVPAIVGDGTQTVILEKVGIEYADGLVVCTANDYVNLEAIMRARDMNPDLRIVARMWDDQFKKQLTQFLGVQAIISASDLAAPAFAGSAVGIEITQTIRVKGQEFSMIRMTVAPGSLMDGSTVDQMQQKHNIDIVLHGRGDDINVHPEGAIHIRAGDTIVVFARHDKIIDIVARNRTQSSRSQPHK